MSEHLPRWRLEEGHAEHAHGCEHCAERKRALDAARERFIAAQPAADFMRATRERALQRDRVVALQRRRRVAWGATLTAMLAAAAALLVLRPAAHPPEIRFKGGAAIEVFVKRGQQTAPLREGAALRAGDQLAFAYSLAHPRHLLLLSIDDTGAISRYFPSEGAGDAPLDPGARVQLPVGVELDAHRGEERLVALFSDTKLDELAAQRALKEAYAQARAQQRGLEALPSLNIAADQASTWFRKP